MHLYRLMPAALTTVLVFSGCAAPQPGATGETPLVSASSSRVLFKAPETAVLTLHARRGQPQTYTAPAIMNLPQTEDLRGYRSNAGGRPVSMALVDGSRLKGFLYVYRLNMDQIERLAEVSFFLTPDQVAKLKEGQAVTVTGFTARNRPVYKIILGIDR